MQPYFVSADELTKLAPESESLAVLAGVKSTFSAKHFRTTRILPALRVSPSSFAVVPPNRSSRRATDIAQHPPRRLEYETLRSDLDVPQPRRAVTQQQDPRQHHSGSSRRRPRAGGKARMGGVDVGELLRQGRNDILAGSLAGSACKLFEYPLDTIKVQMQTRGSGGSMSHLGPIGMLRMNVRDHGFMRLYQGISSPLVGSMAENATLFVSFGVAQSLCHDGPRETMPVHKLVVCAMSSGVAVSTVLTPVELIKCRMQTLASDAVAYKSTLDCLVRTVRDEGVINGLFRGHSSTLMRELPGNVSWFGGYEVGCYLLTPAGSSRDELPAWKVCMAGSLAGMAYWGVPYPADVVKSKIQTGTHGLVVENGAQPSIAAVAKETMRREGVPGFYRGCGITVARAGPGNGLLFVTYEMCLRFFEGKPLLGGGSS